ncbi:hypothetical protein SADUNF_Sadunf02G0208000 [Salix dunnii]|uniref:DNA replication checkpoint mediator MRC1 domain-containing protein n=1 Tax=Salix dunnii TaxID=1413687 RepID=A0A835TJ77_9ROSI|nr:hypothetical protein SADUNF_Sadunf02G0208000 [Salix dunnii]
MDSEEELLPFSDTEKPSSPLPLRKFKRLKKATNIVKISLNPLLNLPNDTPPSPSPSPSIQPTDSPNFEILDAEEQIGEYFSEPILRSEPGDLGNIEEANDLDTDFSGSGNGDTVAGVKRALKFDSVDEELNGQGMEEEIRDFRTEEELDKKLPDFDGFEEIKEKRKKESKSGGDGYGDEQFWVHTNRRREAKERRERHKELIIESQKLLRETREASFKPVSIVQKPVSSLIENIRLRKREVSKKFVSVNTSSFNDTDDAFSREVVRGCEFENDLIEEIEIQKVARADSETTADPFDEENSFDSLSVEGSKRTANQSPKIMASQMDLNGEPKQTFRAPVDDTQDMCFDSQKGTPKDEISVDPPSSPMEGVQAPSLLAMNLKLDSAPPDEFSDEEDNDKENIGPIPHGLADLSLSPKGDPMKAFIDEQAEVEDDSDHDLMRFRDSEEDEDDLDSEELNDMIETGYKEKPFDNEIRNELHQKWLEQQDADGTENLLRRLKCGSKRRETTLLEGKEDEGKEDEEAEVDEEEFLDEAAEVTRNVVRMNLKKAKEMISQMFTDKDVYISSDDEETETRLVKEQLSYKAMVTGHDLKQEDQATFLSPAEAEGSKEIFGLIKKLNGVPDTRKKAKILSYSHMRSITGNRNMSSKSSFVGRGSKSSLPSSQKHGSSMVRSFVFERDDSNSRSAISIPEDSSNLILPFDPYIQSENRPRKTVSAKFSGSQIRSSTQNTQTATEMKSGPSLHEILRCPSLQSTHHNSNIMADQVEAIYDAFKLDRNQRKNEPRVSIRTGYSVT